MLEESGVLVGIAVAVFVVTAVFLVAVAAAVVRRRRGGSIGPRFGRLLAVLGGLSLGVLFLVNAGIVAALPLVLAVGLIALSSWRLGRRTYAGWLIVGAALPWTALWGIYVWAMLTGLNPFEPSVTWLGFVGGLVPVGVGLAIAGSGDRAAPPPGHDSARWQPGARTIGTLTAAIRGSNSIGPFGIQELAAIVAIVVSQLVVSFALAIAGVPGVVTAVVLAVVGAVAATEAYIRAMPPFNRKAFEAFSWLGDEEIARVREVTGEGVPLSRRAAEAWLTRHPATAETARMRPEVLLMAGRVDDARTAAEALPTGTPWERATRAATIELVAWLAGAGGELDELEAAARELPAKSDDGLRAAVLLAAARTRLRMSDGRSEAGDAALPLVEVRARLGHRADGQVGRALRRRLLPVFFVTALVFGLVTQVLGGLPLR
jgi:cadmium resistance protein CadD (predicted permease)